MEDQNKETAKEVLRAQLEQMRFPIDKVNEALKIYQTKEEAIEYLINSQEGSKPEQKMVEQNDQDYEDEQEDYKMIFVVRMDLKLALGKIAQLVATAALRAYKQIEALIEIDDNKELAFFEWTEGGQRKIVVKSPSEKELIEVVEKAKAANINYVLIHELPSNLRYEKSISTSSLPKKKKKEKQQKNLDKVEIKGEEETNKSIKQNQYMIKECEATENVQKNKSSLEEKTYKIEKDCPQEKEKNDEKKNEREIEQIKENETQKQILVLGAFGPAAQSDIDPFTKHFKLM